MSTRLRRGAWVATLTILLAAGTASAQIVNTATNSGDWEATGTWSAGVPGSAHDVVIPTNITVKINGLDTKTINSLSITGVLTHATNTTSEAHKIVLEVETDVAIAAGGTINVSGKGYGARSGPGTPNGRNGGAHGGEGGKGYLTSGFPSPYGSMTNPVTLGAGSGSHSATMGRPGGGAVILRIKGYLTNNGIIEADGVNGRDGNSYEGGGAGGTINIQASSLTGNGILSAMGGNATPGGNSGNAGGGAGGRIAVILSNGDFSAISWADLRCNGGTGSAGGVNSADTHGAAGTIYLKANGSTHGDLIVNNADRVTGASTTFTNSTLRFDAIMVTNSGTFATGTDAVLDLTGCVLLSDSTPDNIRSRIVFGPHANAIVWPVGYTITGVLSQRGTNTFSITNLTIGAGAILSHEANGATEDNRLDLLLPGWLTIQTGGAIDVSGKGYAAFQGPGSPNGRYGGGHGGEGGLGNSTTVRAPSYGSVTNPVRCGSGSGGYASKGHPGGGVVILRVTGALANNGAILADGQDGVTYEGGGAGGSINITAASLSGSGTFRARGGDGKGNSGGGAGGRIAILLSEGDFSDISPANMAVYGGARAQAGDDGGAAGTIYLKPAGGAWGEMIVDNNNPTYATLARTQIPPAVSPVLDELRYVSVVVTNRGALAITASDRIASLTVADATEPINLGVAGTRLTVTGMLFPDDPPRPHGLRVNGVHYTRLGFYSRTDWNGYDPIPANVAGDGDIWLRAPAGSLFQIR